EHVTNARRPRAGNRSLRHPPRRHILRMNSQLDPLDPELLQRPPRDQSNRPRGDSPPPRGGAHKVGDLRDLMVAETQIDTADDLVSGGIRDPGRPPTSPPPPPAPPVRYSPAPRSRPEADRPNPSICGCQAPNTPSAPQQHRRLGSGAEAHRRPEAAGREPPAVACVKAS